MDPHTSTHTHTHLCTSLDWSKCSFFVLFFLSLAVSIRSFFRDSLIECLFNGISACRYTCICVLVSIQSINIQAMINILNKLLRMLFFLYSSVCSYIEHKWNFKRCVKTNRKCVWLQFHFLLFIGAIFDRKVRLNKEILNYAVETANSKILIDSDIELKAQVETIEYGNEFEAAQTVCSLLKVCVCVCVSGDFIEKEFFMIYSFGKIGKIECNFRTKITILFGAHCKHLWCQRNPIYWYLYGSVHKKSGQHQFISKRTRFVATVNRCGGSI